MKIEMTKRDQLIVQTPYHPDLPAKAQKLGGRFAEGMWRFDLRDEERVRTLLRLIFGTDGEDGAELVTIRVTFPEGNVKSWYRPLELFVAGRKVATAKGRDSGARIGAGVVVLAGGFSSGGSMKNPRLETEPGTVIEIRDVPRPAFEQLEVPEGITVELLAEPVVDSAARRRETLEIERETLRARLVMIEAELASCA